MSPSSTKIQEAIARAKEIIEKQRALKELRAREAAEERSKIVQRVDIQALPPADSAQNIVSISGGFSWNAEQQAAIQMGLYRKNFCLIGAAGTGKTTTTKGMLLEMLSKSSLPPLEKGTKYLLSGSPGIALISFTRRAVRNLAKQMPEQLKSHCITFHKLVEYEPEEETVFNNETGQYETRMRFAPQRNEINKLPHNLRTIVIDEASMLSTDHVQILLRALPSPSSVQFIVLGDLNQLPPVYGNPFLGKALLEYPIVELTQVYRQALESPIISLALAVKNNNFESFIEDAKTKWGAGEDFNPKNLKTLTVLDAGTRGKVTLHPWKKILEKEDACDMMGKQLAKWALDGTYSPEEDLILCPWNKSFGTKELNLYIAHTLSKTKNLPVYEVIAGFNKLYLSVGDKLIIDKQDCFVLAIETNPRYLGKQPTPASTRLNRWGTLEGPGSGDELLDGTMTDEEIEAKLNALADIDERVKDASHKIKVRFPDTDEEIWITAAGTLNAAEFGYATTVHKAQGSECRRVFFLTHPCHAAMCSRELVYTALTRAAQELYIVFEPRMLGAAAKKPRIKGDTLEDKLAFFKSRLTETGDYSE